MQITIDVKDKRYPTFLAFLKTLDYVSVKEENDIPQWQIDEVNQRIKSLEKHPEKAIDFDVMLQGLEKKYGL